MHEYCETEGCDHQRRLHAEAASPSPGACRITGCRCGAFNGSPDGQPAPRRISIDVPDGYAVHVSLVPIEATVELDVTLEADPSEEGDGR